MKSKELKTKPFFLFVLFSLGVNYHSIIVVYGNKQMNKIASCFYYFMNA